MSSSEHIVERRVGDIVVRIDRTLCVGFGDCMEVAPEAFEFDDEGIVRFLGGIDEVDRDRIIQACDICPVDALTVVTEDGDVIVP